LLPIQQVYDREPFENLLKDHNVADCVLEPYGVKVDLDEVAVFGLAPWVALAVVERK
jgi:hypothetical protein